MSTSTRLPTLALAVATLASACTAAPPAASSPTPATTALHTPTTPAIDHPSGRHQVVLRYEEAGGFMPVESSLGALPIFTLYGDGTVAFRDPADQPTPGVGGLQVSSPLKAAKLSDEQVQELLAFAISEGGLAGARDRYDNPMLADAPNALFTIDAGGRTKQVTVTGLLESDASAPDKLARLQFLALAERLRDFDAVVDVPAVDYRPAAWRVHLVDAAGAAPAIVHPWPWPALTPGDFSPTGDEPIAPGFPQRSMNADELAQLEVEDLAGGLSGYYVRGPDGKLYGLVVRPLLPDEES